MTSKIRFKMKYNIDNETEKLIPPPSDSQLLEIINKFKGKLIFLEIDFCGNIKTIILKGKRNEIENFFISICRVLDDFIEKPIYKELTTGWSN